LSKEIILAWGDEFSKELNLIVSFANKSFLVIVAEITAPVPLRLNTETCGIVFRLYPPSSTLILVIVPVCADISNLPKVVEPFTEIKSVEI